MDTNHNSINVGSDYCGVGAMDHAMNYIGIKTNTVFACDFDEYARKSWIYVHGTPKDIKLVNSKEHKKHCQQIKKLFEIRTFGFSERQQEILNAADDYAKNFSFYFPFNVYDRKSPDSPLDFYMTSPPCQSFSLAGKRLGKLDKRGILFFNSLELIQTNKPRFFVFENVKGLVSHDEGRTFSEWVNLLGGKSVNGLPVLFPYEDSVPYHIYYQVLNSKKHGTPQNRERIFIIGIRDDEDNAFEFPAEVHLEKRLKDVLEQEVYEKYFLSDDMVARLIKKTQDISNNFSIPDVTNMDVSPTITAGGTAPKDNKPIVRVEQKYPTEINVIGYINQNTQASKVYGEEGISPALSAGTHGVAMGYVGINSEEESKIIQLPRGHNKGGEHDICPTITTNSFEQNNFVKIKDQPTDDIIQINDPTHSNNRVYSQEGVVPTLRSNQGGNQQPFTLVPDSRSKESNEVIQINPSKESGGAQPYKQNRIFDANGVSPVLDTECGRPFYAIPPEPEDVCIPVLTPDRPEKRQNGRRFKNDGDPSFTLTAQDRHGVYDGYRIRRLTPLECFRLMAFPDSHVEECKKHGMSDSQLYKQAGNSIDAWLLSKIIKNIKYLSYGKAN